MRRQAAGKVPFRFRKAAKAIWRNERASEENDVAANEDPQEEAEEDLEGDGDSQAPQDLDNGQGTAQLSTAAALQQTGRCMASELPHPSPLQIQSQSQPHHRPLSDGVQAGQTDGTPAENRRSPSGPAGQEPSHDKVSCPDRLIECQNLISPGTRSCS